MFVSWRMNGKLCNEALRRRRSLGTSAVQIAAFQGERNIRHELYRLKEVRENFGSNLVVDKYQVKKVEFIPGPSIEGQLAATKNLHKILQLLEDDKGCIIGVIGIGGVGKITFGEESEQ